MKQRSTTNIVGLGIIVVGILFFLKGNPDTISSILKPWWIYIILGYAIYNMIKKGISIYNIAMAFFAISYIGRNAGWIGNVFKGSYILAAFIILFGINIMVKRDTENNRRKHTHMGLNENTSFISVFNDRDVIIDEKIIDGTHLFALFADLSYDAKHANCEEETIIEVTSIFSDVDLYVPDNVNVVVKGNPILGDIKDRRRMSSRHAHGPTLTLRVLCLFGDVRVR